MGGPVITNKRELVDHLRKHDPETLEFLIAARQAFGEIETIAYVQKPPEAGSRRPWRD